MQRLACSRRPHPAEVGAPIGGADPHQVRCGASCGQRTTAVPEPPDLKLSSGVRSRSLLRPGDDRRGHADCGDGADLQPRCRSGAPIAPQNDNDRRPLQRTYRRFTACSDRDAGGGGGGIHASMSWTTSWAGRSRPWLGSAPVREEHCHHIVASRPAVRPAPHRPGSVGGNRRPGRLGRAVARRAVGATAAAPPRSRGHGRPVRCRAVRCAGARPSSVGFGMPGLGSPAVRGVPGARCGRSVGGLVAAMQPAVLAYWSQTEDDAQPAWQEHRAAVLASGQQRCQIE